MRTRIERQVPDHADGLFAALTDPRIYTFLDETPPESVAALRARLERLAAGGPADGSEIWHNWTVFNGDRVVGYVQATEMPGPVVSIAYVLSPEVWGRGVAYAACCQMLAVLLRDRAPVRFEADTELGNLQSQALLARLGFRQVQVVGNDMFFEALPGEIAAQIPPR